MSEIELPFTTREHDVKHGIGHISKVVSLRDYFEECDIDHWSITRDGRCNMCGYDRGTYESHTEVDAYTVECRNCNNLLRREK